MHIPQRPLPIAELTKKLAEKGDPGRLISLFGRKMVDEKGRYLHWDEFRRKVNDDGLSLDEGWFAIRTARITAAQFIPLMDTANRRFSYCEPSSLRATLQFVDLNAGGTLGTAPRGLTQAQGSQYFTRTLAEEPFLH